MNEKEDMQENEFLRYSTRNPQNIAFVRIILATLMIVSLDFSDVRKPVLKPKVADWANEWIAENSLNVSKSVPTPAITSNLVASNEETIKDISIPGVEVTSNRSVQRPVQGETEEEGSKLVETGVNETPIVFSSSEISKENLSVLDNEPNQIVQSKKISKVFYPFFRESLLPMNRWFVSASMGVGITTGEVLPIDGNGYAQLSNMDSLQSDYGHYSSASHPKGFSISVKIGKQLGNKMELLTGFDFQQYQGEQKVFYTSQIEKTQSIYTSVAVNNTNGTPSSRTVESTIAYTNYFSDSVRLSYSLQTLEIPLVLRYYFGESTSKFFCGFGTSAVFMSNYTASFTSDQFGTGNYANRSFGMEAMNLLAGIGYQYSINSQWSAVVQTNYKYTLAVKSRNSVSDQASIFNGLIGVQYYFK